MTNWHQQRRSANFLGQGNGSSCKLFLVSRRFTRGSCRGEWEYKISARCCEALGALSYDPLFRMIHLRVESPGLGSEVLWKVGEVICS
jgi:hypothetical protein